jgi:hypothetical protein
MMVVFFLVRDVHAGLDVVVLWYLILLLLCVDGLYNKVSTVKISGSRGVYNKFHAHFLD